MHKAIFNALRLNTRRQFLRGATGAALAVTIPASAKADDSELLALERELVRSIDAFNEARDLSVLILVGIECRSLFLAVKAFTAI